MTTPTVAPDAARAAIPRFAAVLDRPDFRADLARRAADEWGWGRPEEVSIRPLKWHRERCTFEIGVRTRKRWHAAIAKVFESDQPHAWPTMQRIRAAGFAGETPFTVPRPLAYLQALHVLLEERVEGSSTRDILLHGGHREQCAAAGRCGEWLARFHATAPLEGEAADPRAELEHCRQWADDVARFGEPLASESEQLYDRVVRGVPDDTALRASHGSYIPEHVLLSGSRTVAIDLDECTLADPSRDIAWFIVSVQRLALVHLGSLQALEAPTEQFLRSYLASSSPAAVRHVPFYRAVECLHRARRDLVKRTPPVPQWASLMLQEGLRAL